MSLNWVSAPNIIHHTEVDPVTVGVGSDCEYSAGEDAFSDSDHGEYDEGKLESIRLEKRRVVSDRLENFKILDL